MSRNSFSLAGLPPWQSTKGFRNGVLTRSCWRWETWMVMNREITVRIIRQIIMRIISKIIMRIIVKMILLIIRQIIMRIISQIIVRIINKNFVRIITTRQYFGISLKMVYPNPLENMNELMTQNLLYLKQEK